MEDLFATLINIAFYIFIFKLLGGLFSKKKPPEKKNSREQQMQTRRVSKPKKKESFLDEAIKQLKKLETQAVKEKPAEAKVSAVKTVLKDEYREPGLKQRKEIDEKTEEIYYNREETKYSLGPSNLKQAIVFSEIIGKPVSQRRGLPYRR